MAGHQMFLFKHLKKDSSTAGSTWLSTRCFCCFAARGNFQTDFSIYLFVLGCPTESICKNDRRNSGGTLRQKEKRRKRRRKKEKKEKNEKKEKKEKLEEKKEKKKKEEKTEKKEKKEE